MRRLLSFYLIFWICTVSIAFSQGLEQLDSVEISTPIKASKDRLNNIYIVDDKGNINKYNSKSELVQEYSPQKLGEISLIEAWNPLKVFIYYQDFQEYVFLDRFLTASNRFSVRDFGGYVNSATISADNNIWLMDYSDFSLKKYDVNLQQLLLSTPLNQVLNEDQYDIQYIREYQNLLFIADDYHGILIFDNLGNYLRKIEEKGVSYFNFIDSKMYYSVGSKVKLLDLYNNKSEALALDSEPLFTFIFGNKLVALTESHMISYKILKKQ